MDSPSFKRRRLMSPEVRRDPHTVADSPLASSDSSFSSSAPSKARHAANYIQNMIAPQPRRSHDDHLRKHTRHTRSYNQKQRQDERRQDSSPDSTALPSASAEDLASTHTESSHSNVPGQPDSPAPAAAPSSALPAAASDAPTSINTSPDATPEPVAYPAQSILQSALTSNPLSIQASPAAQAPSIAPDSSGILSYQKQNTTLPLASLVVSAANLQASSNATAASTMLSAVARTAFVSGSLAAPATASRSLLATPSSLAPTRSPSTDFSVFAATAMPSSNAPSTPSQTASPTGPPFSSATALSSGVDATGGSGTSLPTTQNPTASPTSAQSGNAPSGSPTPTGTDAFAGANGNPSPTSAMGLSDAESSPMLPTATVVGGVVGGVAGLTIVLLLLLFVLRRVKQKRKHREPQQAAVAGADPSTRSLPPAAPQPGSTISGTGAAAVAAGIARRFSRPKPVQPAPPMTEARGFERLSGRKLPSQFSPGMEGPPGDARYPSGSSGYPSGASRYLSGVTASSAALNEDPFADSFAEPMPAPVLGAAAAASAREEASSPSERETIMPGPGRTPVVHQGSDSRASQLPSIFAHSPPSPGPLSPGSPNTDGRVTPTPSFDGSRGSRFQEDFV